MMKAQSPLEIRFFEDCQTVGLLLDPQFPVGPIHADFAIPNEMLVIECDSEEWHSTMDQVLNDDERDKIYRQHGYDVLRLRGRDIYADGEVLAEELKYIVMNNLPLFHLRDRINARKRNDEYETGRQAE
jgi:very-short-patch-repair endonuclease